VNELYSRHETQRQPRMTKKRGLLTYEDRPVHQRRPMNAVLEQVKSLDDAANSYKLRWSADITCINMARYWANITSISTGIRHARCTRSIWFVWHVAGAHGTTSSPAGGTKYLCTWNDDKNADDWRSDGYRWRQGGSFEQKAEDGVGVLKRTYFKVRLA